MKWITTIAAIAAASMLAACEAGHTDPPTATNQPTEASTAVGTPSDEVTEKETPQHGVNYDKNPCDLIDTTVLRNYGFDTGLTDISVRETEENLGRPATLQLACANSDWSVTLDAHYFETTAEAASFVEGTKPSPSSIQMSEGSSISPLADDNGYMWINYARGDSQASWAAHNYAHQLTVVWDQNSSDLPHTINEEALLNMASQLADSTADRQRDQGW